MADVHGIKEALEAVKVLGVAAKEVLKDGKVGVDDLAVVVGLIGQVSVLLQAVKDVSDIPAEVKDIDIAEGQELIAKVLEVVAAIKAA